jgi:hypothetical protein
MVHFFVKLIQYHETPEITCATNNANNKSDKKIGHQKLSTDQISQNLRGENNQ